MIYDTTMFTRFMHEIGFEPWTPKISGAVFGAIPSVLLRNLSHFCSPLKLNHVLWNFKRFVQIKRFAQV